MAQPDEPSAEGSFLSHLIELRNRLLRAVVAVGIVFAALVPFANQVYEFLADPLLDVLPSGTSMIATEVASPFLTPIKLTFLAAIVVAVPYLLYQLWAFVAPGLYRHERRLVMPLLLSSTVLFYAGMAFAYFVVFPVVFTFFVGTAPKGVAVMTDIRSYLDFVFTMFFAFGIAFEVPVALVLLAKMGVVDPESLAKKRPYVVLGIFVIAAFLTPPDIFSQTFLAVPMLILFEVGLFIARRLRPSEEPEGESGGSGHREMTEAEMDAELDRHEQALNGTDGKRGE
ncbi:twin-arginine protein translocation system subunit TatC [Sulfurifustis variabilis]|uniref:Sec-independent protein translocase protein TatC n=1 Tax=Sulfurifustis variabilis TaxID=1675686 RepID=A0A1B4V197_9GAMM|nr:twin-arginine protein translocation system subunit TatC [Sulfurifustis variabilis]